MMRKEQSLSVFAGLEDGSLLMREHSQPALDESGLNQTTLRKTRAFSIHPPRVLVRMMPSKCVAFGAPSQPACASGLNQRQRPLSGQQNRRHTVRSSSFRRCLLIYTQSFQTPCLARRRRRADLARTPAYAPKS